MVANPQRGHVVIEDLTKTFEGGNIVACQDVTITIGNDELVVLLGPSGCGKTTTLRCVAGLETPDSGRIFIGGEDVTDLPPKQRDIAFVFQTVTLFPHKSVRGNMRFGLDMKTNLSADAKNDRIKEAAELLGIEELLDRKPAELSGGQRQRVSLGRAMVMEPQAFLLDEPFSALDANLRDQMQTEIQRLQHEVQKSMIFVTHDQEEAMTIGDRIVIMKAGTIQQVGTPYQIYNDPENLFVAEFIGSPSTNIISCSVATDNGSVRLENDAFSVALTGDHAEAVQEFAGQDVHLGLRPANFELSDSRGLFSATVEVVETLGEDDAVYFSHNGLRFCAKTPSGAFTEGSRVSVDFAEDDAWVFAEAGDRII